MITRNEDLATSRDWREYLADEFGEDISLLNQGQLPRIVVLKTAGDLCCANSRGVNRTLTNLPAYYPHVAEVATILAGQKVPLIVYW